MASPIDDDVELTEEEMQDEEVESDDETYIETLTLEVVTEHEDRIVDVVDDPETPEDMAKNESIKKFLVQKVRNRLLESFEDQLQWLEDTDLVAMMRKWKKATAKDNDVDASIIMKRIIKDNAIIAEAVEQHLEDMLEDVEEEKE